MKFHLNIKNPQLFYCEGSQILAQVPRVVVETPSLQIFTTQLDMALGNLLWLTLLAQGGWTS